MNNISWRGLEGEPENFVVRNILYTSKLCSFEIKHFSVFPSLWKAYKNKTYLIVWQGLTISAHDDRIFRSNHFQYSHYKSALDLLAEFHIDTEIKFKEKSEHSKSPILKSGTPHVQIPQHLSIYLIFRTLSADLNYTPIFSKCPYLYCPPFLNNFPHHYYI